MKKRAPLSKSYREIEEFTKFIDLSYTPKFQYKLDLMKDEKPVISFILENLTAADLRKYEGMAEKRTGKLKPKPRRVRVTEKAFNVFVEIKGRFASHIVREEFDNIPPRIWRDMGLEKELDWNEED